jgi:hypothetical protein
MKTSHEDSCADAKVIREKRKLKKMQGPDCKQ